MEYNIDNAELTATLTAVNLDAAVIGQAPLEVVIGESARIDVGEAINYVKSGAAEIAAAVQEGTTAFDLNAEQKTADFNDNASNKTAEYNQNADNRLSEYNANDVAKTAAYNQNASDKTDAFNTNAGNQFDDYNANASNKLNAYNDNATAKLAVFNQNASDKTTAYDNNAATKTQAYNDNATAKTTAFDGNYNDKLSAFNNNASAKTQAFDDNVTAKTTAFNDNAAIKQAAVDDSADAAAASAATAKQYAIGVPSEPSGYSAKYWAEQTEQSLSGLQSDVVGIKAVIPASATASNKLTDKSYVDTADNNLQSQIDAITASSDVTDIVGTYADLQNYDTSALAPNSIIKVLQDESRNNETTYYRWVITGGVGAWLRIGEEGPYYTISAADAKFATQTALSTGLSGKQDTLVSGTNIKTINGQSVLGSGDLTVTTSAVWGSITGPLSAQTDLQNALNAKQDTITDLTTIRSGASAGATAVQPADLATVATSGDYADLSGTPNMADYVTLATSQDITGAKTFQDQFLHFKTTAAAYTETPAANLYSGFNWLDKNGTEIGAFYSAMYANGGGLCAMNIKNKSGAVGGIAIRYGSGGTLYTETVTPIDTTTTSGTQIATTGWVNSTGNNVVHLSGDETIGGNKTFTGYIAETRASPYMVMNDTSITKGTAPASLKNSNLSWLRDSNGKNMTALQSHYNTDKETRLALLVIRSSSASDTAQRSVALCYPTSGNANFRPLSDNDINLGISTMRWKQLYAGTTTISTSDERLKQGIESVPDAALDAWGEVEFYRYKFNDAVEEKGFDNARYHTGMVAQRIRDVFAAHGLNAFEYGLLCYDEWEAKAAEVDDDGNEITPALEAGNRYSLRYEECLCMEAAYQRRRAERIEARLAALEARL